MLDAVQTLLKEHIDSGLLINELVMNLLRLQVTILLLFFYFHIRILGNEEVHVGSAWQAFISNTNVKKIKVIIGRAKIYWSMHLPETFNVQA